MVFIVLLFPLALLAMTTLMDAVEDLLSSLMTPARRRGLAGAAQRRRRTESAVRAAAPAPAAAPPRRAVDRRPVLPAEYDAPTAQAAGWY
ncbi:MULTISPECIES: hypothetical protein [Parafrankia]|uniref:hypothetical protein n=1 Tax=Parafrankia TaxID=2994362 RepID=UPI000B884E83|nr:MULTISPECIES: hypothetical protein [Parafrankia]MBE3206448.1 hypothetical protein [Parafrankia sp. CH37]